MTSELAIAGCLGFGETRALASGQRTAHAMADWGGLHTPELIGALRALRERAPNESALRRALRAIDLAQLDGQAAHLLEGAAAETPANIRSNVSGTQARDDGNCAPWKAARRRATIGIGPERRVPAKTSLILDQSLPF